MPAGPWNPFGAVVVRNAASGRAILWPGARMADDACTRVMSCANFGVQVRSRAGRDVASSEGGSYDCRLYRSVPVLSVCTAQHPLPLVVPAVACLDARCASALQEKSGWCWHCIPEPIRVANTACCSPHVPLQLTAREWAIATRSRNSCACSPTIRLLTLHRQGRRSHCPSNVHAALFEGRLLSAAPVACALRVPQRGPVI